MTPDPVAAGVADAPSAPSPHRVDYDEIYRRRRSVSTMHEVAMAWSVEQVRRWRTASPSATFRILSIGCGDGELDVAIIAAAESAGATAYVGCDVNAESLRVFAERAATAPLASEVRLVHAPVGELSELERFDLVLLSHSLYYFDDPAAVVVDALDRHCAPGGRVVVVHSGHDGVPAMTKQALGSRPFTTAEEIVDAVRERGVSPRIHRLDTEIALSDEILSSEVTSDLFGFLVERESLTDTELAAVVGAMKERSTRTGTSWVMREEVLVLEIRARLVARSRTTVSTAVDPIRDYHALEEAFDWTALLKSSAKSAEHPVRLLDVGCGTGRWLRVLAAANPELTAVDRARLVYDRIDPVSRALSANTEIASSMFEMGDTWTESVEEAALPSATYDLIWSVHSLYAAKRDDLTGVLAKLVDALVPGGVLLVALGAPESFYIDAKPRLLGTEPFTSSADVVEVVERLGLTHRVHHVDYVERFDLDDDESVRRFVWHESIGNSFLPAGLGGELPAMPTGEWFDSFRGERGFEFRQCTGVVVVER